METHETRQQQPGPAVASTELTAERRTVLAAKLAALLADFSKLTELERVDLEPVSTEWLVRSYALDRR